MGVQLVYGSIATGYDGYIGTASKRLKRRRNAQAALDRLFDKSSSSYIIHYSCQSFYDRPDGASPRITSIAVRNMESRQTVSFSIHQFAEVERVNLQRVEERYDGLERAMLDGFYEYIPGLRNVTYGNWNMRDANYGFPAIAHRYRVLGGIPENVDEGRLLDISSTLIEIYGRTLARHPRLESLMTLNAIRPKDFLSGQQEGRAFDAGEYVKLHQSTLRKVDVIHNIATRAWDGSLKTEASRWEQAGGSLAGAVEDVTEHWAYRIVGFIGITASVVGLAL